MSTSSQIIERIENAVYHEPYMIPALFNDCRINHGFLHSRLRRYVPHRVGIEFECFGDFANQYIKANHLNWKSMEIFRHQFHLRDFSQDSSIQSKGYHDPNPSLTCREEIRVSVCDYRQLNGLYNIMKEMAKYCSISDDCGIHIHIDLTKYDKLSLKSIAVKWFNNHLHEVESIFPPYKGTYNKRNCGLGKGNWINISMKGTVEFRIAPLTFDYEELIVWIIKCSKLVSRMISECQFNKLLKRGTPKNEEDALDTPLVNPRNGTGRIGITDYYAGTAYTSSQYPNGLSAELSNVSGQSSRLNRVVSAINAAGNDIGRALLGLIRNNLIEDQIDWYIMNELLVMTYPDNTTAVISINDAVSAYVNGGFDQIINAAIVENSGRGWERSGRISNGVTPDEWFTYEGGTSFDCFRF